MGQAECSARTGTTPTVRPDSVLEPISEKQDKPETVPVTATETKTGGTEVPAEGSGEDDVERSSKKSLAFKLAFIGLAASMFVFQLDATALGIALPVSNTLLFLAVLNRS